MTEPVHGASRRHVQDLDVLRGLAILMVLAGNMPFNLFAWRSSLGVFEDMYWNGSAGIDLFMAVTGFTTARALLQGQTGSAPLALSRIVDFLVRRFWRRTLLAWVWIAIPLILGVAFDRSGAFHPAMANLSSGVAALLEVSDVWQARVFDAGESGIAFPYWTLSLGTQFALLLPVLAATCGRWLPCALATLLAYTFAMPQQAFCFYTRPGALALGALLAMGSRHPEYRLATPHFLARGGVRGATLAAALLVLGALQSSLLRPLVSVPFGVAAVVAGGLVYAASFDAGFIAGAGLIRRAGACLGRRSYAIYLTHVPAFALTRELYARFRPSFGDPGTRQAEHMLIVAVVLTVLASEASYRLVQIPGQRRAEAFRARVPAAS